jgi:hypothetical protein
MAGVPRSVALMAVALVAGPIAAAAAASAPASPTPSLALRVTGACPDRATVDRLLAVLRPDGEGGPPEPGAPTPVTIDDQGGQYRIAVGDQVMTLEDPARDCPARARQAVAVVASGARTHPQVFGPPRWTVEKGAVFDGTMNDGTFAWAPGAEMRGAYGRGTWSLVAAGGARGPARLVYGDNAWKAEVIRLPVDLGARVTAHRWRLRPWLVLAPTVTVTGFIGEDLLETERVWRLDPGALAMAGATLRVLRRMGLAIALSARWQPRPYELHVAPVGKIGETPRWWFGLSLNYTIDANPSSQ